LNKLHFLHALPVCSLERVGHLDRPAVGSLCALKALTALTIITATDATADILHHTAAAAAQQQQQQAEAGGGEAVVAANAALGAPDAVAGTPTPTVSISASSALLSNGSQGLWLPLLELPLLQELVLGSAHRSQQLNLTGSLTAKLHSSGGIRVNSDNPSALPGLGGDGSCSSSGCSRVGHGGCSWYQQVNEAVSAYVCPTGAWSDLSNVKVCVMMRLAAVNEKNCISGVQRLPADVIDRPLRLQAQWMRLRPQGWQYVMGYTRVICRHMI
jgi:hypothetical protein